MTRRKRTSSPLSPQKRVSFEIPASLHQLSTISRSLATTTEPHASMSSGSNITNSDAQLLQRPSSQSSLVLSRSPATQTAPTKTVPQKRSFPEPQQWVKPGPRLSSHSPGLRNLQIEKAPGRRGPPTQVSPPSTAPQATTISGVSTSTPCRCAPTPTSQSSTNAEPTLQPGETPLLDTHPNLIASLIAKKRAENEARGNRERWARKQAEYRMSKSPASQLMNELKTEAGRTEVKKDHSNPVTNKLPARSMPAVPAFDPSTPIVFDPQTPLAETVSTPAAEGSNKAHHTTRDQRPNDSDSLFGSPYGSPMAEFLERATDDVGLRDAGDHPKVAQEKISADTSVDSQVVASSQPSTSVSTPATAAIANPPENVSIPPLFTDTPLANQSQAQSQAMSNDFASNPHIVTQGQPAPNPPAVVQGSQSQVPSAGGHPPLAPRQQPLPQTVPWYQQHLNMPGYYRIDFRQGFSTGVNNYSAPPPVPVAAPYLGQTRQWGPPPPPQMAYPTYPMAPMAPMGPYMTPGPPPPPGPIQTYGSTVAAAAAAAATTPDQKKVQTDLGLMTAADMVAGINTKFRIATKRGFSVPKRY